MKDERNSGATTGPARFSPTADEFAGLRGRYRAAMVTTEVSSDLHTPVSAFMKLAGPGPCFLLESAESGKMWGRYSFIGFEPAAVARSRGGALMVAENGTEREIPGNPVRALTELVEGSGVHVPEDMPFSGGAVGYLGFEAVRHLEKVPLSGGSPETPDMVFMFPGRLLAFDHLRSRMRLHALAALPNDPDECRASYEGAVSELREMIVRLRAPLDPEACLGAEAEGWPGGSYGRAPGRDLPGEAGAPSARANMSGAQFERMVAEAREQILAGEVFQVVVSARFSMRYDGDPLSIYRQLRAENPSPYMFYMRLPGLALVGSSPEPMVTRRGEQVMIRPIAGTRRRGRTGAEDEELELQLTVDPKEKAEHVMLVDLARNDLGRVCRPGTVKVERMMEVERYSRVMHMVSEVRGEIRPGLGNYELLRAAFPAGTVSGAPKIRACELIGELEPEGRGPYAGAIGYLAYSGDMDTCIAIRTAVVQGDRAVVQAGAGIVADSVPAMEWKEALSKAEAVVMAVSAAREAAGRGVEERSAR